MLKKISKTNKILFVINILFITAIFYIILYKIFYKSTPPVLQNQDSKVFTQSNYSFEAPKNWIESSLDFERCHWGGIANDTSDGHRMAGEIGIYPTACFDPTKSNGKREMSIKDGHYIIAYYDKETGTTDEEIQETKDAYSTIVETFAINK